VATGATYVMVEWASGGSTYTKCPVCGTVLSVEQVLVVVKSLVREFCLRV
jgi:hypothetical protein